MVGPRAAGGVRRERHLEGQRLLGQERVGAGPPGVAVRRAGDRGVDRGQRVGGRDRPVAARDQPGAGAVQRTEGVLPRRPLLPQERQRQVEHLVVEAGPERLHVRGDAELGEPRHVVGVDQLQVGDVVAPGRVGPDHRVQRLAHRPVTDGVHVHLETGGVQRGHGVLDRLGVQEGVAAVVGGVAAAVEVRLEQRGGAVLGHAVLHHLHGGRAEPAPGQRLTPSDQVGDLLDALAPVPPEGADHVRAELAARGRVDVGRARVVHARVRADDRVLPAGDAERVQVVLTGEQRRAIVGAGGAGQVPRDEGGRPLVEGAARVAVRVALDPAVRRVRRLRW